MADVVPGMLSEFQSHFNQLTGKKSFVDMILKADKTYADAEEFAKMVGEATAEALNRVVTAETLPDGRMYYNIAERVLGEATHQEHEVVSAYAEMVQLAINEEAGLGLKPVTPEFSQERLDGMVNKISNAPAFQDVAYMLGEPIVNFAMAVTDSYAQANAEFQYEAGVQAVIKRTYQGGDCAFCRDLDGTYTYPDMPDNVFQRHLSCRCIIEYTPKGKPKQTLAGIGKKWEDIGEVERKRKLMEYADAGAFRPPDIPALNQKSDVWYESLTKREKASVQDYTGTHYRAINDGLRDGNLTEIDARRVAAIDEALTKFELPENTTFYRGVGPNELQNLLKETEFKNYKSISADEEIAENFIMLKPGGEVVRFRVPAGSNGAYIGNHSLHKHEDEFLLPRGSKYSVERVDGILEVTING